MGVKKGSGRSRAPGYWSFLQFRTEHPPSLSRVPTLCPHTISLCNEACAQVGLPEMIRQQHDAVRVEPLRLQRVDTPQHRPAFGQINHGDGPVAHAFQVEQAVLDKEVAFIGRQHAMVGALSRGDGLEKPRVTGVGIVVQVHKSRLRRRDE